METLGFKHYFNYLDHKGMEAMLASPEGEKFLELARNISVCLHEDWKQNLIREKGTEYQHFRPVKDAELASKVLANKEEYLNKVSADGKHLFRIVEGEKDGQKTYDVQFDLIRVPFEDLSKKWQEANLEAAKFALCLVKTAADGGQLEAVGEELFKNFEMMSHDVHLEWMYRESGWAAPELLLPYEYLTIDTPSHNEKDKDRAHIEATTAELTFQPNIMERNRSIVIRAINELFGNNAIESGLNPEILKNIVEIKKYVELQNQIDYQAFKQTKQAVIEKSKMLKGKTSITFEELETLAKTYFETWKESVKYISELPKADGSIIGALPKSVNVSYDNLTVDDVRVNHKNISRIEVRKILESLVKEQAQIIEKVQKGELDKKVLENIVLINPQILADLADFEKGSSPIGKRVASKNEADYADYLANLQNPNGLNQ